jgi:2-oxoisovalerate dehydrogenase E2 component (dihydrolipoyl transacylase)
MFEFKLPDPGEGLQEAEIVHWLVAVGDVVAVNDILLEIETAKSLVELPSPYAGVVADLLVAEGDLVDVGTPIIRIGEAAEVAAAAGLPPEAADEPTHPSPGLRQAQPTDISAGSSDPSLSSAATSLDSPASASVPTTSSPTPTTSAATSAAGFPSSTTSSLSLSKGATEEPSLTGPVQDSHGDSAAALLVGYGAKPGAVARRARRSTGVVAVPETDQVHQSYDTANPVSRRVDDVTPTSRVNAAASGAHLPPPGRPAASGSGGGRPLAKPAIRRVARDLGVDLTTIRGSGPGGLITAEDVVAAIGSRPGGDRRIALRGVRRAMFTSMTDSLQIPQATAMIEADVTGTADMLETLKMRREFAGLRVSPLLVFAKAACLAMSKIPEINSSYDAENNEIVLHSSVNLGIAAATPRGLLVPNIKGAEQMNLVELAEALNAMVAVAREGRVQPYDLANGTFTITNIGVFGVDGGTPILSPGESAIMCLGTIRRKPWVMGVGAEERLEPRSVCTVSLTFDHRLVDGAMASKFLAEVATIMSNPGLALMF